MINNTFISLRELNDSIWNTQKEDDDFYTAFLDKIFPNWNNFIIKKNNDNLQYYDEKKLKFSLRINLTTGRFEHIDIYLKNEIRPYRRVFLVNGLVKEYRYYEFNSWTRNYDVVVGNTFRPIYTIEYFQGKERYIDFYHKPGALFYNKNEFLKHMYSEKFK